MIDYFSKSYHRHLDSGLISNGNACSVYLYLLRRAAFKEMHVGYHKTTIFLREGEVLAPRQKIALQLDLSEKQVRGAIAFLTKLKIIVKNTANRRANNLSVYRFVREEDLQSEPDERATLEGQVKANQGPTEGQPYSNKRDSETKNTPVGSKAQEEKWNPWGSLMRIFKDHAVPVHTRGGGDIGVVNALGAKVGHAKFFDMAVSYCTDDFYRDKGRSAAGFTNAFNKLSDRVTKAKAPEAAQGAAGKGYSGPVETHEDIDPEELAAAQARLAKFRKKEKGDV